MDDRKNADRFKGFADVYDSARPKCPEFVLKCLTNYLGRPPETVVDIGCGTGLSTFVWSGHSAQIIGVEPSSDMLAIAKSKADGHTDIRFVQAFSDATGLAGECADIVTCSQSFHWMNPETTLPEIARILKPGGVFAAYDCDWPPVCGVDAESADEQLCAESDKLEEVTLQNTFVRWSKNDHLVNIKKSGLFRYTREIVFHNMETCTAERYKKLALSQGGLQGILKAGVTEILPHIEEFEKSIDAFFKDNTREIFFCYRMRIGIK